jgi:hypothetical protein
MAIGDPVELTLQLVRIATAGKLKKGEVIGVVTRLVFESDTLAEEDLERLVRFQHAQELRVTVLPPQLGLGLPATKPARGRRARAAGRRVRDRPGGDGRLLTNRIDRRRSTSRIDRRSASRRRRRTASRCCRPCW